MDKTIIARWRDWSGNRTERLILKENREGIHAESVIISKAIDNPFAARYEIVCDNKWHVKSVGVELLGEERKIGLTGDGKGNWSDESGARDELRGAIDTDITATPFTNTLPIRRLKLGNEQSADIVTVYIHLPGLSITTDPQRYTFLEAGRLYRFESLDSDFARDIEVDADGLVLTYPGLFKRFT